MHHREVPSPGAIAAPGSRGHLLNLHAHPFGASPGRAHFKGKAQRLGLYAGELANLQSELANLSFALFRGPGFHNLQDFLSNSHLMHRVSLPLLSENSLVGLNAEYPAEIDMVQVAGRIS